MNEFLFPLAAVVTTFFFVIPLLTLISRSALLLMRQRTSSWVSFGSEVTFAWLVAPTLLPVLWLTSSALHQSEPMRTAKYCFIDHIEATTCIDTLMLLGLMTVGVVVSVGIRLWRERPQVVLHRLRSNHKLVRRVERTIRDDVHLRALRVIVVRKSAEPLYTLGLLRPIVVVDACFIREADEQMLRAALLHEHAHITGFDTLRSFIVRLCLGANPAGRLLAADFERWRNAREAVCDGEAVHRGGEPLALAEGILKAARFRCDGLVPGPALCGHGGAVLKLRLALLMHGPSAPVRTIGHTVLAIGVFAALTTPHIDSLGLLKHFHFEVERLFHSLP